MKKKYEDRSTVRELHLSLRISAVDLKRLEELRNLVDPVRGKVSQSLAVSHALYLARKQFERKVK